MPPSPSRHLRLSTDMLPERDRFAAFREEFARRVLMMDVIDRSDGHSHIEIIFMPLDDQFVAHDPPHFHGWRNAWRSRAGRAWQIEVNCLYR
jgi:hypothetical protein